MQLHRNDRFSKDPLSNVLRAEEAAIKAVDDYYGVAILPSQRNALVRRIRTQLLVTIVK